MIKKILIISSIFLLSLPFTVSAEAEKVVFITEVQNIKPNTVSDPITIQLQDADGNEYKTTETFDLQFLSSSETGEFLGGTGKSAQKYISSGTTKRSFYYKDASEGNFTITINVRGRQSGTELTASQKITVSTTGATYENEILEENDDSPTESTNKVSSYEAKLDVLAGNDRLTTVGSPLTFQAVVKKNNIKDAELKFNWSFGDGGVDSGFLVKHAYKYPGNYTVVLSTVAGDIVSVNKIKVKVVEPNISIKEEENYLEIFNNSNTDINLFGWKIENGGKGFIFQPDTIVEARNSLKLDKSFLSMKGLDNSSDLVFKDSFGREIFKTDSLTNKIAMFDNLKNIEKQALVMQDKINNESSQNIVQRNIETEITERKSNISEVVATSSQTAVIYEAVPRVGLLAQLTNFIKRVFFK